MVKLSMVFWLAVALLDYSSHMCLRLVRVKGSVMATVVVALDNSDG
jgi:hypothetical protein